MPLNRVSKISELTPRFRVHASRTAVPRSITISHHYFACTILNVDLFDSQHEDDARNAAICLAKIARLDLRLPLREKAERM